jgi:hypothetical protein
MSNVRKISYHAALDKAGRKPYSIMVKGKPHFFNINQATIIPEIGRGQVNIKGKNYWFPTEMFDPSSPNFGHYKENPVNMEYDAKNVSRTIAPVQFPRVKMDLKEWKDAITEAEMPIFPYRVKMQQIYQDLILDGHVYACWQKRKRLTLSKRPSFFNKVTNQPEENNKTFDFIHSQWWYTLTDYLLDAQGYGYQLISLGDKVGNRFPDLSVVRRQNISPDREIVSPVIYMIDGIHYDDPDYKARKYFFDKEKEICFNEPECSNNSGDSYYDWHIWVRTANQFGMSSCGYGIFYQVALFAILMRNNLKLNADFVEMFAQPIRWLKTNKTNESERAQAELYLQNMGSNAYIITDKEDEFQLLQNPASDSAWQSYTSLEERCKKSISAVILGHEDCMSSIPGKMGSQQGNESSPVNIALKEIENEQDKWLCSVINDNVLPKLRNLGFNIPEDVTYGYQDNSELSNITDLENKRKNDFANVVETLTRAGYEVDEKFVEEQTGIPVRRR